jgi:hypothetical protein
MLACESHPLFLGDEYDSPLTLIMNFFFYVIRFFQVCRACIDRSYSVHSTFFFFSFLSFTLFSILELYAHFFVLAVFGVAESIWANDQRNCFFFHQ